jgi:hypothetical protein
MRAPVSHQDDLLPIKGERSGLTVLGAVGRPGPCLPDEPLRGRPGSKGLDGQRRVPDAGPRPAPVATFESCGVAVESPARGDPPRLVLEAREREEHLGVDQHQVSVCELGAAVERQGDVLDLVDAVRHRCAAASPW